MVLIRASLLKYLMIVLAKMLEINGAQLPQSSRPELLGSTSLADHRHAAALSRPGGGLVAGLNRPPARPDAPLTLRTRALYLLAREQARTKTLQSFPLSGP